MKRPWLAAAGTAALTSLLFVVLYNLCNYFTALRPDVGVWVFGWEKHWPLVPAMIVPYWSIDALFVVAPFLCTSRKELRVYQQRMIFAIAAAALCYFAIPLQFAFARPQAEGAFGPWFTVLHGVDLPHNLFPSLHITLRTLLAAVFLRKTHGVLNWAAQGWFSLVGISTLLTWQHHLVDVLGGFWLAAIAMHLYRFDDRAEPHLPNRRVATYYAGAALVCSQLARLSWPWTFPLVWPAFACGVAAFAYSGWGPVMYRKHAGQLTRMTKLLFAPLLVGQWLSWRYYRGKTPGVSRITPQVWVSALPTSDDARKLIDAGVTSVLDLTAEFSAPLEYRALRYHSLPVLDLTSPTPEQLTRGAELIDQESARGTILVHCKAGYSRSGAMVGAWLLETGRCESVAEVVTLLKAARSGVVIREEIRRGLLEFSLQAVPSAPDPEDTLKRGLQPVLLATVEPKSQTCSGIATTR